MEHGAEAPRPMVTFESVANLIAELDRAARELGVEVSVKRRGLPTADDLRTMTKPAIFYELWRYKPVLDKAKELFEKLMRGELPDGSIAIPPFLIEAFCQVGVGPRGRAEGDTLDLPRLPPVTPGIEREWDRFRTQPIDWRKILIGRIYAPWKTLPEWKRPPRRAIAIAETARELVGRRYTTVIPPYPRYKEEPTVRLAIIYDTSGSIGSDELGIFADNMAEIVRQVRPKEVWVMDCDVVVHHVYRYDWPEVNILARGRPTVTGRGATAFTPPFRVMIERGIKPDYIIYMTDLQPTAENPWPELPGLFA
ncbi:MAG: hypothetical protein DRP01_10555, partial [Archaeoglobales archaeon]